MSNCVGDTEASGRRQQYSLMLSL